MVTEGSQLVASAVVGEQGGRGGNCPPKLSSGASSSQIDGCQVFTYAITCACTGLIVDS